MVTSKYCLQFFAVLCLVIANVESASETNSVDVSPNEKTKRGARDDATRVAAMPRPDNNSEINECPHKDLVVAYYEDDPLKKTVCVRADDPDIIGVTIALYVAGYYVSGVCDPDASDALKPCDMMIFEPVIEVGRDSPSYETLPSPSTTDTTKDNRRYIYRAETERHSFAPEDRPYFCTRKEPGFENPCPKFERVFMRDTHSRELELIKAGKFRLFDPKLMDWDTIPPDELIRESEVVSLLPYRRYTHRLVKGVLCADACSDINRFEYYAENVFILSNSMATKAIAAVPLPQAAKPK